MSKECSENKWLTVRFNGPDAYLWFKAKKMVLLKKQNVSAIDLIGANIQEPNTLIIHQTNREDFIPKFLRWTENTDDSVRTLVDRIVTRWRTEYLHEKSLGPESLHKSLIDIPCYSIPEKFGKDH